MTLTLSGLGGVQPQSIQNAGNKLQAAIASIVSGSQSQASDVADLSIASQLQSQTAALRQVSSNLAQAFSLTQVADGGATQIQAVLGQLQTLAQQAKSPTLNVNNRQQLNEQFQQLSDQIDILSTSTTFNGQPLLNGSVSGNNALSLDSFLAPGSSNGDGLSIGSLSSSSLFGGQSLNILNADNAGQASDVIGNALNQLTGVRAGLGSFQQTVNYAAANVDSALANQQAAQSNISDTDIASASTQYSLADIQQNAAIALAAQGNNLSPALLQLVG